MKLAQLILPLLDNGGHDLFEVHRDLQFHLLARWGGYTSVEAVGGWKNAHDKLFKERVVVYSIAMPLGDVVKLRALAAFFARRAKQESVMIVTPNGDVDFIHPQAEERASA